MRCCDDPNENSAIAGGLAPLWSAHQRPNPVLLPLCPALARVSSLHDQQWHRTDTVSAADPFPALPGEIEHAERARRLGKLPTARKTSVRQQNERVCGPAFVTPGIFSFTVAASAFSHST